METNEIKKMRMKHRTLYHYTCFLKPREDGREPTNPYLCINEDGFYEWRAGRFIAFSMGFDPRNTEDFMLYDQFKTRRAVIAAMAKILETL